MTREMRTALISIGDDYGYMDDTWPDMVDDMVVCLMNDFDVREDMAEAMIDDLFRNGIPR